MGTVQIAHYGSWKSPITTDMIVSESISLQSPMLDGSDIYWLETRPLEGGRSVVVRRDQSGSIVDITPPGFNVRTRVHEYGGGAYTVADGTVYFANFDDQRLYRQSANQSPTPITPVASLRFADFVVDKHRGRLICVREDHSNPNLGPLNVIVAVDITGEDLNLGGRLLVHGNDFYASPRLSPDGQRLAWLTWNHPNMPWDGTELWVGEFGADGGLTSTERIAGGPDEAIFQPEWSPDGTLYFVSDRTGWWNLYRWSNGAQPLIQMEAEFGVPQWLFGMSTYAFVSADRVVCAYCQGGVWYLASIDTQQSKLTRFDLPYTYLSDLRAAAGRAVFIGGTPTEPLAVIALDLSTGQPTVLRREFELSIDPGYISIPEIIEFPTTDGQRAYGLYYPPRNRDFAAPPGERPPLIVMSHGGPTAARYPLLSLGVQYWTSRGFAVLDVNYGGSTGYGRAYRERLNGQWGVVDVDDCVNGARYLVERGLADPERLIIRGGSAGGYTTLAALTFRNVFRAGASYYGVSDLEALAKETHKFEAHYLDRLIGPYPEARAVYQARSPLYHAEQLACPVIFFQGLEDAVVPPNQAERMVEKLRAKGIPVAYVPFAGEQHGFRKAETIKRALEAELYFYGRVFGFTPADEIQPVEIANL